MKEIHEFISLNSEDYYPWIIIENDKGEEIYSAKGNSLVANWILGLYGLFNTKIYQTSLPKCVYNSGTGTAPDYQMHLEYGLSAGVTLTRIEEPAASGLYRVEVVGDNSPYWRTAAGISYYFPVQIMGIGNGSAFGENCNGNWWLREKVDGVSGSYWLADIDSAPLTYPDLLATGAIDTSKCTPHARAVPSSLLDTSNPFVVTPEERTHGFGEIELGYNGDANIIEQRWLNGEIPKTLSSGPFALTQGAISVATPIVGATTSILEVQQTFTNNNGSSPAQDITFKEVGYFGLMGADYATYGYHWLLGRDVVAPTTITGGGGSVTIKYQFIVATPITGGILATFQELMYRRFAGVSREVKDINNDNQDNTAYVGDMTVAAPGGSAIPGDYVLDDNPSELIGPQVGHSSKDVVNTDFRMQYEAGDTVYDGSTAIEGQDSRYVYGNGAFQLKLHGSLLENLNINSGTDKAGFDVVRIFHNENGSPFRKVLTVVGSAGTLRIDIDGVDYDEAYTGSADTTAANWVLTHAATLLALDNSIIATDSGAAEITMVAEREFVTTDQSVGGMSFSKVETRDDIVINETGLYVGRQGASTARWYYVVCIMKKRLAAPINLGHDEFLKLTITFEVNV